MIETTNNILGENMLPLADIAKPVFNITPRIAQRKAATNTLPVPAFRIGGTRKGMATQAQIRAYWVDCLWQKKGYDSPQEFLEKDNCFACGFDGPGTLERAHITALSEGGGNDADNLHMLCRCCHHDSEMLSGDEYWRWFMQRNIMDRLLSESVKRGFNAFSAIVRCNDCSPRNAQPQ